MDVTQKPGGFAGFFSEWQPARDVLDRQAAAGSQLSGQIGQINNLGNALTGQAMAGLNPAALDKAGSDAALQARGSIEAQRAGQQRNMARMGISPASGRFQASNADAAQGALAEVSAANLGRTQAEEAALGRANNALGNAYRGAALGLQLDTNVLGTAERGELNNRQQQLNAAQLALNKYQVDNNIAIGNKQMDAQADAAKGQAWGNALNFGLTLADKSGLLQKGGDALLKWWNS